MRIDLRTEHTDLGLALFLFLLYAAVQQRTDIVLHLLDALFQPGIFLHAVARQRTVELPLRNTVYRVRHAPYRLHQPLREHGCQNKRQQQRQHTDYHERLQQNAALLRKLVGRDRFYNAPVIRSSSS